MVSYLSQKKQYIKINQEGIEVGLHLFRSSGSFIQSMRNLSRTLEYVWKSDKFVLLERMHKSKTGSQEGDLKEEASLGALTVKYRSIESFLEDDELVPDSGDADQIAEKGPSHIKDDKTDLLADPSMEIGNGKAVEVCTEVGDGFVNETIPSKKLLQEGGLLADSKLSNSVKIYSGSIKVAFVSVKNPPLPATTNGGVKEDPFFSLLTGRNVKNSLF